MALFGRPWEHCRAICSHALIDRLIIGSGAPPGYPLTLLDNAFISRPRAPFKEMTVADRLSREVKVRDTSV